MPARSRKNSKTKRAEHRCFSAVYTLRLRVQSLAAKPQTLNPKSCETQKPPGPAQIHCKYIYIYIYVYNIYIYIYIHTYIQIRIEFWGTLYYNHKSELQNSIGNYLGPYIVASQAGFRVKGRVGLSWTRNCAIQTPEYCESYSPWVLLRERSRQFVYPGRMGAQIHQNRGPFHGMASSEILQAYP